MIKSGGGEIFTGIVNSTAWQTIKEYPVAANIDKIVVAVYNNYVGANSPVLEVRILAQIVKNGEFVQIKNLLNDTDGYSIVGPVNKGECLWGALGDFGFEAVRVEGKRAGSDNVPVIVEFKCLAEGGIE